MIFYSPRSVLLAFILIFTALASPVYAAERDIYDVDGNGLIEINDWADLNEIRNNLNGASLYGSSAGCPSAGCIGFELTTRLNFDTNGDGNVSADDAYWNNGQGWEPIGTNAAPFRAVFDGKGQRIDNLFINRPSAIHQGLFGVMNAAKIHNLGLMGPLTSVTASSYVGVLAGRVLTGSEVYGVYAVGSVVAASATSYAYAGVLVGEMRDSSLRASYSHGRVTASDEAYYVGGLLGLQNGGSTSDVYAQASVFGSNTYVGSLIGFSQNSPLARVLALGAVNNSSSSGGVAGVHIQASTESVYWAIDTTTKIYAGISNAIDATLAELQCPTAADNTACASGKTLYQGWGDSLNAENEPLWDFGTSGQLPALRLNGVVYRDSDGDGVLDTEDAWPTLFAAAYDSDGDGAPDRWTIGCDQACRDHSGLVLDQFPYNPAASIDLDLDGLPDAWNTDCDALCQVSSGLTLDTLLNDADNDGIIDSLDDDNDNDGIRDVDADHNGLIDVYTLAQLDAIRHNLAGTGLRLSAEGESNTSGCPVVLADGVLRRQCHGYELKASLDFDTNADGVIEADDAYWRNNGSGWVPLGTENAPFTGVFDGNGHSISNLFISRSGRYQALFGVARQAEFKHLGLLSVSVDGYEHVSGLVGLAKASTLAEVYVTGSIRLAGYYAAGLVAGQLSQSQLTASFSSGDIRGSSSSYALGGLVGAISNTTISSVYSGATVSGGSEIGGLLGRVYGSNLNNAYAFGQVIGHSETQGLVGHWGSPSQASHVYWATDASGSSVALSADTIGVSLVQLKCPLAATNTSCVPGTTLYDGWHSDTNSAGEPLWDFGTVNQLPALRIKGLVGRDSDGDGVLDALDDFPFNYAASVDSDGDGAPDSWTLACDQACRTASGLILDQFPDNAAASIDLDLDGLPDAWNSSCNASCRANSGLTLDTFLNDIDNDGIPDHLDTSTGGMVNADTDANGLIDIHTLAQLDAVRHNLLGTGRRLTANGELDHSGCPALVVDGVLKRQCHGYELKANLDFDSNGDGVINAEDSYWNNGQGWVPIGTDDTPFSAEFEGNGHRIDNLFINRQSSDQGLFGVLSAAKVRNLGLAGALASVSASSEIGLLAGGALAGSELYGVYAVGQVVVSSTTAGLLVGTLRDSTLRASYSQGSVLVTGTSASYIGGLLGYQNGGSVSDVYSQVRVSGGAYSVGGLIGWMQGVVLERALVLGPVNTGSSGAIAGSTIVGVTARDVYWATDATTQSHSGINSGTTGATLVELTCPTAADDTLCASGKTLYQGWGDSLNAEGEPLWDFGSDGQLPALRLNGLVYRDSDGDGVLDGEDAWPTLFAAAYDSDGDGAPDRWTSGCDEACRSASGLVLDQFPNNAAVSVDLDLDGLPDAWNPGCNALCQANSGLVLDAFPNDADNDGIPDNLDSDTQGVANADVDNNGLIDIYTLAQLNAVRHNLAGTGSRLSADGTLDTSGCPTVLSEGMLRRQCHGYELKANLNLDTNGDGVINASDTYWNNGQGWVPLGSNNTPFTAVFEGNGQRIDNLFINRSSANQGLFGAISGAQLRNLGIAGPLSSIRASGTAGFLAGTAQKGSQLYGVYAIGQLAVSASNQANAGVLVGDLADSNLSASFAQGKVVAANNGMHVGGLVGLQRGGSVANVYSLASVSGNGSYVSGLIGRVVNGHLQHASALGVVDGAAARGLANNATGTAAAVYWATDATGQADGGTANAVGATLAELTCPTAADNTSCASETLYQGWGDSLNAQGELLWDFGTAEQLPALRLNGVVYRDSDGDGVWDTQDKWPSLYAAALDTDNDGYPDAWTPGCDLECQQASGLTLDAFPGNPAAAIDADGDGYPDTWNENCDLACQQASDLTLDAYPNDRDNDGVIDTDDHFPDNPAASLDGDGDGYPDAWSEHCDLVCQQASGLTLDAFPNTAAAAVDSDGDGYPDAWLTGCNLACQNASGLTLDAFPDNHAIALDEDSDGYPDSWTAGCDLACQNSSGVVLDAFPGSPAAGLDSDGDGFPDAWTEGCNLTCRANSGLVLDAFPSNAAASIDGDGDGYPDAWNEACDLACQNASGLTLDRFLNDKDNDGVIDSLDPDNSKDNGAPVLQAVPADMSLDATGARTQVILDTAALLAWDAVDSELSYEVSRNGQVLVLDSNNSVSLPSGKLILNWVAIDAAGNRSEVLPQQVLIYPQVGFGQSELLIGEAATAYLPLSFSGAAPAYPVTLVFAWDEENSTASAADIDTSETTGIDLQALVVTIEREADMASARLAIPVLADGLAEDDEVMVFTLVSATAGSSAPVDLPIIDAQTQIALTITDANLAPSVSLVLLQAGEPVTEVMQLGGDIRVEALVSDLNGLDSHSFDWDLDNLPLVLGAGDAHFTLDPITLAAGSYSLAVRVTDNGNPNLSSEWVVLEFEVIAEPSSSSSSTSSAGSASSVSSAGSTSSVSSVSSASSTSSTGSLSPSSRASTSSAASAPKKGGGGGGSVNLLLLFMLLGVCCVARTRRV